MPQADPDDQLVVVFKFITEENPDKSRAENRPIFDDIEICEIRSAGSPEIKHFKSTELCPEWIRDPFTGRQHRRTYAERFSQQYRQFKAHETQTKAGTPLDHVPFLTPAKRAELRALNVYTLESLAGIEGQELKNLGMGGRELKNQAMAYIEDTKAGAADRQLMARIEALEARNAVLEGDAEIFRAREDEKKLPAEFEDMNVEQLREFITVNSGIAPHGTVSRKTLMRMAQDIRPG